MIRRACSLESDEDSDEYHPRRRHPERSRFSGEARDLPLTGPERQPNCAIHPNLTAYKPVISATSLHGSSAASYSSDLCLR